MIKQNPQFSPVFGRTEPQTPQAPAVEPIALALSVVWLLAAALFFWLLPRDAQGGGSGSGGSGALHNILLMIALGMPIAMIWLAALLARTSQRMRAETARLQASLDALAQAQQPQPDEGDRAQGAAPTSHSPPQAAVRVIEPTTTNQQMPASHPAPAARAPDPDQRSFALEPPAEDPGTPLEREDLIRALNFPETADDHAGFAALRHARKNRQAARLIQAAEDVLTLLSQDGIYMDDLHPDMARPEIWRQFAAGTRGRAISALGGVRERAALEIAEQRLKQDPIFRDVAHHFLRRFDRMFTEFETEASDLEISSLSETRTARAFMLLGRVAGTFD